MLKIRLQRFGRKHDPTFRVVLTDSRNSTKSGRFLEVLGSHDSRKKDYTFLKKERILHWISKGAQVTDTMHNLLIAKGILKGKKINVSAKKKGEEAAKTIAEKKETNLVAQNEKSDDVAKTEETEVNQQTKTA